MCNTARFWQTISVRKGSDWLKLSFSRCAGAPVDLIARGPSMLWLTFDRFRNCYLSHTLRSIRATNITRTSTLHLLGLLYRSVLPILEALTIEETIGELFIIRALAEPPLIALWEC